MAEMTPAERIEIATSVAISALENATAQLRYPVQAHCGSREVYVEAAKKVNATHTECLYAIETLRNLAAQPPAVDRERRLREAALDAAEKALELLLPWALQAGANAEDAIGLIRAARGKA